MTKHGKVTKGDIPADMQDQVDAEKEKLIEDVAEADDELIERYLEGETLSDEDIKNALKKGCPFQGICAGSVRSCR